MTSILNSIERLAILDYRIERLHELIASAQRQGVRTLELEQALAMCIRNRTALYADDAGPATLLAALPSRDAETPARPALSEA